MTTSNILSQLGSPGVSTGFKNRIINGAMVIDQRNAGASVSNVAATATYAVDRWKYYGTSASKFTIQQNAGSVTPPAGYINYLGFTSSAATVVGTSDIYTFGQPIEGLNITDLAWGTANAKTITLSAWVYSSLTGTFSGSLGNGVANRCYPFTYTISSANTWTQISITVAGDTSGTWLTTNGIGIQIWFNLGSGSTQLGTAGAWGSTFYYGATSSQSIIATSGATFYITGVQLEVGTNATNFDYRPYGTELALCQRYYRKTDSSAIYGEGSIFGYNVTGQSIGEALPFPVQMRATPTIAYGGTWVISNATQLLLGGGQSSYLPYLSVTTTGQASAYSNASGYITFSAEL